MKKLLLLIAFCLAMVVSTAYAQEKFNPTDAAGAQSVVQNPQDAGNPGDCESCNKPAQSCCCYTYRCCYKPCYYTYRCYKPCYYTCWYPCWRPFRWCCW